MVKPVPEEHKHCFEMYEELPNKVEDRLQDKYDGELIVMGEKGGAVGDYWNGFMTRNQILVDYDKPEQMVTIRTNSMGIGDGMTLEFNGDMVMQCSHDGERIWNSSGIRNEIRPDGENEDDVLTLMGAIRNYQQYEQMVFESAVERIESW